MIPLDVTHGEGPTGLHELVLFNTENGQPSSFHIAFWNSRHRYLKSVETKQLYIPIIDTDGRVRWAFSSRKDDLTKLSWLAKFHAQDIKSRIMQHADVQSVCVGGEGRAAPWVIIDPKEGVLDRRSESQLLTDLYERIVTRTNKSDIDEIRIPRETVLITKKEKPLTFSLKQLVQRRAAEKDYTEEIEQAYLRLDETGEV
jgi:long-subunit acyl-CoA synthetase (AMP-forming)